MNNETMQHPGADAAHLLEDFVRRAEKDLIETLASCPDLVERERAKEIYEVVSLAHYAATSLEERCHAIH